MQVSITVNGEPVSPRHRAAPAARALHPRHPGPDRHPLGLRHVQLRRLRRADGRQADQVLHHAGRDVRGPRDPDRRVARGRWPPGSRCRWASTSATRCSADSARPGMVMTARALLDENPDPSELEIRTAISGAICRCTGYKNIVSAVEWAARATKPRRDRRCEHGHRREPARARAPSGRSASVVSSARRTRGSSAARAPIWMTSGCRGWCTARSCAAPTRTRRSSRSTPRRRSHTPTSPRSSPRRTSRRSGWRGCRRSPMTPRPCSPATRSASRVRRSRS